MKHSLVGPTGSGKSNVRGYLSHSFDMFFFFVYNDFLQFVEKVTGKTGLSSANLRPCTLKTSEFKVSLPEVSGSEICLVDTRGFGTEMDGIETFKKITNWWIYMLVIYSRKYSGGYFNEPWLFFNFKGGRGPRTSRTALLPRHSCESLDGITWNELEVLPTTL